MSALHDPWAICPMTIVAIEPEIDGVATYDLEFADPRCADYAGARPGQFNMLYVPGVGESAISLSGKCGAVRIWRHTVRVAGRVTQSLAKLRPGAQIGVRGPFGSVWPIEDWVGKEVVLLAGGIGLAPLRPVIYELLRDRSRFGAIHLIYGAREPRLLLFEEEYVEWQAQGISVHTTVDRASPDWTGQQGVVTLLLDRIPMPRPQETVVAICGPEVMMRYGALSAGKRGITVDRIWVSLERNMQCAVGLCGHCQLGPEFICKDGPVLRYDRVRHLLAVEAL